MTDDRYELLNPTQLGSTVRSFPRRYREVVGPVRHDPDLVGRRLDGDRVVDLVADTVRTLALVDRALATTFAAGGATAPAVVQGVVDATARHWPECAPEDLAPLLDELADVASALGEVVERAPLHDWSRTAPVAGGLGTREAIAFAREAARTGAENLRRLERLVARLT